MKLNKVLIYLFVFKVLFVSSANLVLAYAPSSLDGYKMSLSIRLREKKSTQCNTLLVATFID